MTEEEKNAAAAFIKLQDDVRQLIVNTVATEVATNPYGTLSTSLKSVLMSDALKQEMHNFRIVYKGTTAQLY